MNRSVLAYSEAGKPTGAELSEAQPTPEAGAAGAQSIEEADAQEEEFPESPVNYDEEGLGEVELQGVIYRFDSGKQGTALCLSSRTEDNWRWRFLGEVRWDGRDLRSKALERKLLAELSLRLRELISSASEN